MKRLLILFVLINSILLLCVSNSKAQSDSRAVREMAHLKNPKVQEVIKLSAESKYSQIQKIYKDISTEKKMEALDLLVFAASKYKNGDVINWEWVSNEANLTMLQNYVREPIQNEEDAFRKGVINYAMGQMLDSKNLISNAYNNLTKLASEGWVETYPLVSNLLYEIYLKQYQAIGADAIAPTIVSSIGSEDELYRLGIKVSEGFADVFARNDVTQVQLQARKFEASQAILKEISATRADLLSNLLYNLYDQSVWEPGLIYKISVREAYNTKFAEVLNKLKLEQPDVSNTIDITKNLYNIFYNSSVDQVEEANRLIKLTGSKKAALENIIDYASSVQYTAAYEVHSSVEKKWGSVFREEILQLPSEYLEFIIRFTDFSVPFLEKHKVPVEQLLNSLAYQEEVLNSLKSDVSFLFKNEYVASKFWLLSKQVGSLKAMPLYNKSIALKQLSAKRLFDYHLANARLNKIHSPSILFITDEFSDWSPTERASFAKSNVSVFINDYIDLLTKSGLFVASMEKDLVINSLNKLATNFGLPEMKPTF